MRVPDSWMRLAFLADVADDGGEAWVVGGSVRDLARNRESKDLDVVVRGIALDRLGTVLSRTGKVSFVGKSFGVFKWTPDDGATVDVGLPRTERSTGPGHRDFAVRADPAVAIEDDLARRDFTVNAVAVRVPDGRVADPWGGLDDLRDGVLRAVGNAEDRFREDPLRILRGCGFVARFGMTPTPETREAMRACAPLLDTVPAERIATELIKLLARGTRPSDGLRLLIEIGAMERVLPEFLPSIGFDQHHPNHHLSLDEHVFAVVDESARRGHDVVVRVAALLHDIAKPDTYSEERLSDGTVRGRTIGHDVVGSERTRAILERLRMSAAEGFPSRGVDDVVALVRHHLIDLGPDSSERAWRRWLHRVGGRERARLLLDLWAADRVGHREGLDTTRLTAMLARVDAIPDAPGHAHDLAIDGGTLARELGVSGPAVGRIKNALLARVVDGDLANRREDLLVAARAIHVEDTER